VSQCNDRRFEKYLHAYELGMLTDEERSAFEIHQLECDHCFDAVASFSDTAGLLRHDKEVACELNRLEQSTTTSEDRARVPALPASRSWRKPAYWRVTLLVAAIVVVLVLRPWRLEFEPTHEIQAQGYRVAVMRFNSLSGAPETQWLGSAVAGLLISDLAQSNHLRVVSGERLVDILNHLGKATSDRVDFELAKRVAAEAGANWALFGDIIQDESELALISHLVDMTGGDIVASQRVEGASEESLFALVDRLTVKVKTDLSLPAAAQEDQDLPVADVTTHSTVAYSHYLDGMNYLAKLYQAKACASWEMAIAEDSTFAMAYYQLSRFDLPCRGREMIQKALRYSDRVSEKEHLLITLRAAGYAGHEDDVIALAKRLEVLYPNDRFVPLLFGTYFSDRGEIGRAIEYYRRAIHIDPYYREAWNLLAYIYRRAGDIESALDIAERYISVAPEEPNAYDTKGELLISVGRIEEGIAAFRKALELEPGFIPAVLHLEMAYLNNGDFAGIEEMLAGLSSENSTITADDQSYLHGLSLAYQGQFSDALEVLTDTTDVLTARAGFSFGRYSRIILRARIHREKGELAQAIELYRAAIESDDWICSVIPVSGLCEYALFLAEAGEPDAAHDVMTRERRRFPDYLVTERSELMTEGVLQFIDGDMSRAASLFEQAQAIAPSRFGSIMMGRSYLEGGWATKAVTVFEALASDTDPGRNLWNTWDAKMDYYLGVACDQAGQSQSALAAFRKYLAAHKAADPGLREIEDARARVARLQSAP